MKQEIEAAVPPKTVARADGADEPQFVSFALTIWEGDTGNKRGEDQCTWGRQKHSPLRLPHSGTPSVESRTGHLVKILKHTKGSIRRLYQMIHMP